MGSRYFTSEAFPEGGSAHLASYLSGDSSLEGLYESYPLASPVSLPERPLTQAPLTESIASEIRRFNQAAGARGKSADHLAQLTDGETRFVIAGQQPGLLFGPPLALYKLLTTVKLARQWTAESGRTVIPLFWIASHDSDRDEIDHIYLPGPNGEPNRYRYPFGATERREQVGGMKPDREMWREWLHRIREALPASDFRDPMIDRFLALGEKRLTVTGLFAESIHQLLPDSGIVLFDGRLAEEAEAGRSIMAKAARAPHKTVEALGQGSARLEKRLITPPLPVEENRLPLFLVEEGNRIPLFFEDGKIHAEGSAGEDPIRFAERAAEGKIRLTPSASLRPVVQDAIFPNAATVVGHSELVYHAQLGPLYDLLEIARPPLLPRLSLFLLHFRTAQKLDRAGLAPLDLLPGRETPLPAGGGVDSEIEQFLEQIQGTIGQLLARIDQKMPGAIPAGDPVRSRLGKEAHRTVERITSLADKAGGNRNRLIHQARNELFPGGRPQEHVTSPTLFLARYGWNFAARLLDNIEADNGRPQLVVVDPREEK